MAEINHAESWGSLSCRPKGAGKAPRAGEPSKGRSDDVMVDNIPPEELEIELSGRQIEQLDAIDNAVYQTILNFLNKTEDEFPGICII